MSLTSLSDSIQIIASKTVVCLQLYCNCNIIISLSYHLSLGSYPLSQSHYDTLNSYNILHSFKSVCTFRIYNLFPYICDTSTTYISFFSPLDVHPFKIIYKFQNNHNKVMYNIQKFDLASPSIDHSIKFSDSL